MTSGFLVVEGSEDDKVFNGLEVVNSKQPEYAKIKKGHVIFLEKNEELPHSVKGSVIRPKAEAMMRERLLKAAEEASTAGVDWSALQKAAYDGGYGADVDAYLKDIGTNSEALAIFGIDSLGLRTLTTREIIESERIGDNVKAWTVTAIVIMHWYHPAWLTANRAGVGILDPFFRAEVGGLFARVKWPVHYLVMAAGFSSSFLLDNGPTPSIVALMFSVGVSDGARDGPERLVNFSRREPMILAIIYFFKLVVWPLSVEGRYAGWRPQNVAVHMPIDLIGFLYFFVWYRVVTFCGQKVAGTFFRQNHNHRLRFFSVFALIFIQYLWNFSATTASLPVNSPFPSFLNVIINVLIGSGSFMTGSQVPEDDDVSSAAWSTAMSWPHLTDNYQGYAYVQPIEGNQTSLRKEVTWVSSKFWITYPAYLIGYWYGPKIYDNIKSLPEIFKKKQLLKEKKEDVFFAARDFFCAACVVCAYLSMVFYQMFIQSWFSRGTPNPFLFKEGSDMFPPLSVSLPDWIWQKTSSKRNGIVTWNPRWARAFYLLIDNVACYFIAFLIVSACAVVTWRAARCGNAALGKFVMMQLWSVGFWVWNCAIVSWIGLYLGAHHYAVQSLQIFLLVAWPFAFIYVAGPIFTAATILGAKLLLWIPERLLFSPLRAYQDLKDFYQTAPDAFHSFWDQYLFEARRDFTLLQQCCASVRTYWTGLFFRNNRHTKQYGLEARLLGKNNSDHKKYRDYSYGSTLSSRMMVPPEDDAV